MPPRWTERHVHLVDQTVSIIAPHSEKEENVEVLLKRDKLMHYLDTVKYSVEDPKSLTETSGLLLASVLRLSPVEDGCGVVGFGQYLSEERIPAEA